MYRVIIVLANPECVLTRVFVKLSGNNLKKCRARYGLDQQSQWCKPCRSDDMRRRSIFRKCVFSQRNKKRLDKNE
ncbi:hypothetical protein HF086_010856 [Spodoptera exigua]|uniref:Uncharacterized protein n=1 Tax=Spodoptera exigua TaxID=7107 RepID=A0A922MCW4_SPOEX|nr:hypothetical protein HF086_010856 [Spodoptera exigua]